MYSVDVKGRVLDLLDKQVTKSSGVSYDSMGWPDFPRDDMEKLASETFWYCLGGFEGYLRKVSDSLSPLLSTLSKEDNDALESEFHLYLSYFDSAKGYYQTRKLTALEYLADPETYAKKAVFLCPWQVQGMAEHFGKNIEDVLDIPVPDADLRSNDSLKTRKQIVSDVIAASFISVADDFLHNH